MRSWTTFAVAPLLLLATACAEPDADAGTPDMQEDAATAPAAPDPAAMRAEIEAANTRFAGSINAGDMDGVRDAYTADARIFPPDAPMMEGHEAIVGFWRAGVEEMGMGDVTLTTEELEVFGETAVEQGLATFSVGGEPARAHYIVVWKRGADGAWRLHRDIWNASPPTEATGG